MTALNDILKAINSVKETGISLSDEEILKILNATKSITKNKNSINAYISFFKRLDKKKLNKINTLTKRELQVLKYIGNGKNSTSIAKTLKLSVSTIETHRKYIRKKLDLIGKGKLFEYAILNSFSDSEIKS